MIRITLELEEVVVAGFKYLSSMRQEDINKYDSYYSDTHKQWFPVKCMNDLYDATKGLPDDATEHTFIKVPEQSSIKTILERIRIRFSNCKIEQVENLDWKN